MSPGFPDRVEATEFTFPVQNVSAAISVSKDVLINLNNTTTSVFQDVVRNQLIYALHTRVLAGGPQEVTTTVKVPATWKGAWASEVLLPWLPHRWRMWILQRVRWQLVSDTEEFYSRTCPHLNTSRADKHIYYLYEGKT